MTNRPVFVDFHFDVMCPYAYQTSRWIRAVRDLTGLTVNWRFFGDVDPQGFDKLIDDLRAGRLDDEVPPHGTLSRVRRTTTPAGDGAVRETVTDTQAAPDLDTHRTMPAVASMNAGHLEGRQ